MRYFPIATEKSLRAYPPGAGVFISHGVGRHVTRRFPPTEHEIIFVRSGRLRIREENEHFDIGPDEAIVLWPGRLHAGTADYEPDLQFYWLHFFCEASTDPLDDRPGTLVVPKHCHVTRPQVMETYFRRYLNDASENRLSPLSASALVVLMLTEIAIGVQESRPVSSPNIIAGRAFAYIQSHLHMPLTTSTVAKHMNCSAGYLSRTFRMVHGRTITEAIHCERIENAQKLLLITNFDVEAIAAESGFASVSYFIKLFKRHTGMTPVAFRRMNAHMHVNVEFEKVT